MHVSKVRSSHSFAHAQFNNGANSARVAKLAIRRPALSPKRRFYSQMAIMATGRGITAIDIELRVFKEKKKNMDKMGKLFLAAAIIITFGAAL